ncbi:FAS1 domain-containing protein [Diaporthe sp. PMI_573]|nr:FAS1 domain-containing protein [Diaporthaceae sp. PMI_573]
MLRQHLIAILALCAVSALAQSLVTTLEENGFAEFAQLLQGDPVLDAGPGLIVYAPTNAALTGGNTTAPANRRAAEDDKTQARNALGAVNSTAPRPPKPPKPPRNSTKLIRDVVASPGSAFMTLLDNPEFVNLGPRRNQTIVEKNATSASPPLVFSGLGASVKVTGADIPFDNGVIRPIDGVLTIPETASSTLPFLGVNTFQGFLQKTGLLAELDTRAGITVLAPDDNALTNTTSQTDAELMELLKRHILIDFPAYTPLLEDGDIYPTLAGGEVTVSVRGGLVYLNGARILAGDAIISNGVIHTIDKVLGTSSGLPPVTAAATTTMEPLSWKFLVCSFAGVAAAARYFDLL